MEREREINMALGRRSRQRAWYGHSDRAQHGLANEDSVKWSLQSWSVHLRNGASITECSSWS